MRDQAKMRRPTRSLLLASASAAALFATPAAAQLVSYDFTTSPGSVTAPNTGTGSAIGNLASQINDALSATAVITGGSGVTTTPGSGAVTATNTLTSNTISSTVAGNVSGPATGLATFVDLASMDAAGAGSAAGTVFQSNSRPNILSGIGVSSVGVSDTLGASVAATFAGALNSTATLSGNTIGSSATGNQANTLVGGNTPGAGVASGGAQIVIGAETVRQRTNTVVFADFSTAGLPATLGANAVGTAATAYGVNGSGVGDPTATGGVVAAYITATPTTGGYVDTAYAAGREIDLSGVIVASTAQQNTGLTTGATIQAITDNGSVSTTLTGGVAGGSLGMAGNSIVAGATGNTSATGIAVTGGAPTVAGGLAVLNGQLNSSSIAGGVGMAGISALNDTGAVTASLGSTVSASTLTLDGNALRAAATGNTATNTLSVATTVQANTGGGAGTGSVSTGVLLAEERTVYSSTEPAAPAGGDTFGGPRTLETTAYTPVTADSSGVAPYNSLSVAADYAAVNVQRNRGADTAPLSIIGTLQDATVSIGGATATTTATTTGSTLAITGNALTAASTGNNATTVVGNGGMLLGDAATVAGMNLQEAVNTTVRGVNDGSNIGVSLYRGTATALTPVVTGGSLDVSTNTVGSTAQVNTANTQLTNLAADGTTLAVATGVAVDVRSTTATAPANLDVSYGATRFAAVSAQRIGTTSTDADALVLGSATTSDVAISAALRQGGLAAPFTAADSSTVTLESNTISAAAGGNASTVGIGFASGSGSTIPGGALAGTTQIIAPTVDGTSLQATVSNATVSVSALGTSTTVAATHAGLFDGGSVSVAGNTTSARVIGNQGSATITGALDLIAGGTQTVPGTGASTTLTSSVVPTAGGADASASSANYVVSNVQRTQPTDTGASAFSTLSIGATTTGAQFTALGGFDASTASVSGNVATSVAAANVFSGGLVDLRPAGDATQLAVSQQDVASTAVTASLTGSVFGVGTGRLAAAGVGTWETVTGTSGGLIGSAVSVSSNTARAFAVMNESALTASGATLTDLSAAGTGAVVDASATGGAGSVLALSGATMALASQQAVALDRATTTDRVGSATVSSTTVGIFGGTSAVAGTGAVSGSTLTVASNTVDARMVANAATQTLTGDYFGGGVGLMNSQSATQTATAGDGLSSLNSNTTIAINLAPPVAGLGVVTSTAAVSGNTIGASTMVNDATQTLAALRTGSVGTSQAPTVPVPVSTTLATGTSASPLNVQNADYVLGNVQTSNGVRASASTTGAQLAVLMPSSGVTSSLQGNRVFAEVMGNRLTSTQSMPFNTNAFTQTASYQANTGSSFNASVSGASVSLTGGSGTSASSTALLSGNTIGASAMGNVLRATVGSR